MGLMDSGHREEIANKYSYDVRNPEILKDANLHAALTKEEPE
jgi:hypothetical protein